VEPVSAPLLYSVIASLDGYIEDADGHFDWARPSEGLHAAVNELERPVGTYLYGRRMYETMRYWQDARRGPEDRPVARDFADIWRAADKVVFSGTLDAVSTPDTVLERHFEPDAIRARKRAAGRPLSVGGAGLAAQAFAAGLIDECHLFLHPIAVGGGKPALPVGQRIGLELLAERRFTDGVLFLHYRVRA
jgi:dihydrofolate reductase